MKIFTMTRHDYLPFGEELFTPTGGRSTAQGYSSSDGVRQQFTQKERDVETGLDYFLARYYSSPQGRFTSPDPLMASGRASRPQTWNRYSYVLNNPLRLVDPDGLIDADPEKKRCAECEEPIAPQTTILVKSATIKVGTETIQGEVGAFGVTFELNSAQTEQVFGAQSFQVNVNLLLPADVATMTPTTSTEVQAPSQAAVNKALETGQPQTKDTATLTSGSQVRLPENSNFSTVVGKPELTSAGKANRRPLESGVTFSEVMPAPGGRLKTSTASVTLRARSDSVSGNNAFSLRVQGVSQMGQILRYPSIQIAIRPSKQ